MGVDVLFPLYFPCWVIMYMSIDTKHSSQLSLCCRLLVAELRPALVAVSGRVWVCLAWAVAPREGGYACSTCVTWTLTKWLLLCVFAFVFSVKHH